MAEAAILEAPVKTSDKIDTLVEELRQLSESGQTRRPDVAFRLNGLPDDIKAQLLERLNQDSDRILKHMLSARSGSSSKKVNQPAQKVESPKPVKPITPELPPTPVKIGRKTLFGLVAGGLGLTALAGAITHSVIKTGIEKAKEPPQPRLKLRPEDLPPGVDNK